MQTDSHSDAESFPSSDETISPPATAVRDEGGRFLPGNRTGHGNPHAKRVAQLKSECLEAVRTGDLAGVIQRLIQDAQSGDVPAAKVLLDRIFGKETIITVQGGAGPTMQILMIPRNGTESDRHLDTDRPPGV
jgi:hypothetical protein